MVEMLVENTQKISEQHFLIQDVLQKIEQEDHKLVDQDKTFEITDRHKADNE